jgi:hypothetical protein
VALAQLEARVGALESERGTLLDGQEALLAGLESVEAEAEDHEERLALLEGEAERLDVLEAEMGRLSVLEAEVERLALRLVSVPRWPSSLIAYCSETVDMKRNGFEMLPVFVQGAEKLDRLQPSKDASVLLAARDALQREMGELKDRISGTDASSEPLKISPCSLCLPNG